MPGVRSQVGVCFDLVTYPHRLDSCLNYTLCHLPPRYDGNYRSRGDLSVQPPVLNGTGVRQPPYLGGDHYSLVLRFEFFSRLLQAYRPFLHVPYERDCVDLEQFSGLILFNAHDLFVDCSCCCDDDVAVLQSNLCRCIRVCDCSNCTLGISFGVHVPTMSRCLLVEERSVDW